jgi:hypothetical protein
MNKIVQIKVFNDILDQFFMYLENEFAFFRSDIILTKSSIDLIRKSNPRLVVEQFLEYVTPYSKQIMECDDDFFLNFEQNMSLDKDNLLYGLKLKTFWMDTSTQNPEKTLRQKATMFYYFQKLLKSASKVVL